VTALIHGARCAMGAGESLHLSLRVSGGHVTEILREGTTQARSEALEIDLSGFLVMPGLVNAHDHLQFALHPRLGNPPYRNYVDWGEDIHRTFPETIAKYKMISRDVRLWWGAIRNLLCGVTTVCHHDTLWPEMQSSDFPVKVVQQFNWGHSLALGGDLHAARSLGSAKGPFILHACEGIDELARTELFELDRLGIIDGNSVLVHALAIDMGGVSLLHERQASLIICPSSNNYLFRQLPPMHLLSAVESVALGSDSPLTAGGDLLDEIRFTVDSCGVSPTKAYHMVTGIPATILQLKDGEGTIQLSASADLIAIRDSGQQVAQRLPLLSMTDIEFVMLKGRVHLASQSVWDHLPASAKYGLEPLCVDGIIRWVRAPVQDLVRKAEAVLGKSKVRLGSRNVCCPSSLE
jgi:cytosine/adenosine deaminase-related metal-dependent hydrolase